MKNIKIQRGFTIVELLVVIIVVGILATIGFMSYRFAVNDAKKAAIIDQLNMYNKGFQVFKVKEGLSKYPTNSKLNSMFTFDSSDLYKGGQRHRASAFANNKELSKYFNVNESVEGNYMYVSNGNSQNFECRHSFWDGSFILVYNLSDDFRKSIDKEIDDGKPNCGRVVSDGSRLFYRLDK